MATMKLTEVLDMAMKIKSTLVVGFWANEQVHECLKYFQMNLPYESIVMRTAVLPDIYINLPDHQIKVFAEVVLSKGGQYKFTQAALNVIWKHSRVNGYLQLWRKGCDSELELRKLWLSCKCNAGLLLQELGLSK